MNLTQGGIRPGGAVLVTGAAGFLGANIVIELLNRGLPVLAADLEPAPSELLALTAGLPGRATWVTLDVSSDEAWAALPGDDIFAVIHAAAVTTGEDDPHPVLTFDVIVGGTARALNWAHSRGARRFVYVSSSAVYRGVVTAEPLRETMPLCPTTNYGQSKIAAEGFVGFYGRTHGLETAIARLPSLYGPWERPSRHRRNPSPVYQLVEALRAGTSPVRAAGAGVGRDWTYVGDAAAGVTHLALMHGPPQLVNVSWGRMVTLQELAGVLGELSGRAVEFVDGPADVVMTPTSGNQPMDVRAVAAADFAATTPPEEGLRQYWQWVAGARGGLSPHRYCPAGLDMCRSNGQKSRRSLASCTRHDLRYQ